MKLKNIAVGDIVQVKKSMSHSEFEAKQLCQVIDIDPIDNFGLDVLIQGVNGMDWVSHKDLKKPKVKHKQLDQSVFKGWADCWKFFAIDEDGQGWFYRNRPSVIEDDKRWMEQNHAPTRSGFDYGTSNWRDSLIEREPEPRLKQLDQSIFDGLDERWEYAAVDGSTSRAYVFEHRPHLHHGEDYWGIYVGLQRFIGEGYDASNWQNSLIERSTTKDLPEVDLSSELTGSDLCRAMINRGDKIVLCIVKDYEHENDIYYDAITHCSGDYFESTLSSWRYAVPINNQGEPLTASDVGL